MGNWKKIENEDGFFCYINSDSNLTQWDHPNFCDVKQAIDDCNYVAYASYRLALKIRVLQRSLSMEEIPLSIVVKVFERHRLANAENSLILETYDLEAVLSDIFFTANKTNHTNIDIDYATEIAINFLYNVFDSCREGKVQVISCKLILGLLCSSVSNELHKYLFSLCADHNNCITRVRLQGLLTRVHTLMKYLHEDSCFDLKSLNWAVEKCFRDSPGLVGITESNFTAWLNSDVLFLMWLPLVSKLKAAESVISSVKCTTCKTRPLLGLRYGCTKCPKYNQCQRCFLTGRISHCHKLSHALKEYGGGGCNSDANGPPQSYLRKICDILCFSGTRRSYTIVRPIRQLANENIKPFHPIEAVSDIEPLSSPEVQLQNVIRQLESQNRELQQLLIFGNQGDKEMRKYLEEYRLFMAGNIQKLKTLKHQINALSGAEKPESEPVKCKNSRLDCNGSPLTIMTDLEDSELDVGVCNQGAFASPSNNNKLNVPKSPVKVLHNDLDDALAKLQQILANNFTVEDSITNLDNTHLKYAVTEVEGMLTSIIDNVESSRCNSALHFRGKC